jgi:CPA1 family monovalent cation:H+ antiporter
MQQLTLVFVVFLATIIAVPVSARLGLPSPVLMTVFGVALALIPATPNPDIEPDLILPLVLPPLLFAAARRTHWRQFRAGWRAVVGLAVILVLVSTAAVALSFHGLVPGLPIAATVLLGALVSPPDPVAATAVAGDVGLPRRLVNTLETEGLFNDVTAIVIYGVALSAVVSGHFTAGAAIGEFLLSAVIAVVVGLGVGWISGRLMGLLDDATLQVALSLLVPFAAYVAADRLHGSGVLSVLLCGLYLSDSASADDVAYRLVGTAFWDVVELLVTGFAFGLIGEELHTVVDEVGDQWTSLLGSAMEIVGVVVAVRLIWLLPGGWFANRMRSRAGDDDEDAEGPITWRESVVMWWAGMRGVATVALALAIPFTVNGGAPFPGRDQILFTAFVVVLFTLIVQGLTLPLLVRLLGVTVDDKARRDAERHLWFRVAKAELRQLNEIADSEDLPDDVYERLSRRQQTRLATAYPEGVDEELRAKAKQRYKEMKEYRELEQRMLAAGREEMLNARGEPGADPALVDRVIRQLDLRTDRR